MSNEESVLDVPHRSPRSMTKQLYTRGDASRILERNCPQNGLKNKPDEYICIGQPWFDFKVRHWTRLCDGEQEDMLYEEYQRAVEAASGILESSAASHPNWKWVMMRQASEILDNLRAESNCVDPDNFDMYVSNDFYGYGLNWLIESKIVELREECEIEQWWSILTALGHWLLDDPILMSWIHIEDGPRVNANVGVLGLAFLSVLDAIDQEGHLTTDSKFRDLGFVMSIYLGWSTSLENYGLGENHTLNWRKQILVYAKKAGIELKALDCYSDTNFLDEVEGNVPLNCDRAGLWDWLREDFDFIDYIPFSLPSYDITEWSPGLRAKYNYNAEDPLADLPTTDLEPHVRLAGDEADENPIYDTCDEVRRKISAYLENTGATRAHFCRVLHSQFNAATAPAGIQSSQLAKFLGKEGPRAGGTSSVYYAAYVFFEKFRIKMGKSKSGHRIKMESIWPNGMDRERADQHKYFVAPGRNVYMDEYGKLTVM